MVRFYLSQGLGHIEINMIKGLFKLLWPIYFKDLAAMLGFRTVRAQTCCQNATDHHKAMQMFEIALFALADELIYEYCNIANRTISNHPSKVTIVSLKMLLRMRISCLLQKWSLHTCLVYICLGQQLGETTYI